MDAGNKIDLIKEQLGALVDEVLDEARLRESEVSLSDGTSVRYASREHIQDLERRLKELLFWRDKHKRGSDARGNYARVINRVRGDLTSAKRHAERSRAKKVPVA